MDQAFLFAEQYKDIRNRNEGGNSKKRFNVKEEQQRKYQIEKRKQQKNENTRKTSDSPDIFVKKENVRQSERIKKKQEYEEDQKIIANKKQKL